MLYDILPKWALFTFVIFVILFSIVAEWLLQRKEKKHLKENFVDECNG